MPGNGVKQVREHRQGLWKQGTARVGARPGEGTEKMVKVVDREASQRLANDGGLDERAKHYCAKHSLWVTTAQQPAKEVL